MNATCNNHRNVFFCVLLDLLVEQNICYKYRKQKVSLLYEFFGGFVVKTPLKNFDRMSHTNKKNIYICICKQNVSSDYKILIIFDLPDGVFHLCEFYILKNEFIMVQAFSNS